MNKEEKTVCVRDESITQNFWGLKDFIGYWQNIFDQIPDEYKDSAQLYLYGEDGSIQAEVTYRRPETDKEYQNRRQDEDARLANKRKRDLELLTTLKAKYE